MLILFKIQTFSSILQRIGFIGHHLLSFARVKAQKLLTRSSLTPKRSVMLWFPLRVFVNQNIADF